MTPMKQGAYEFKKDSLLDIQKRLKLKQGEMAELLGVPPNTLSRWETGATVPDANSLATIYSIAKEHGTTPAFFGIRREPRDSRKPRNKLLVMWDFYTLGVSTGQVTEANTWIQSEVKRRFDKMSHELLKAFSRPSQSLATDILDKLGWRVWEDDRGMDEELIDQSRSDAGQDPSGTILVLVTRDVGFLDLIDELQREGVRVYLLAPEDTSPQLVEKVGRRRWIKWSGPNFSLPVLRY